MQLSIGEKIMVQRHRKGLSRKELGHRVYIVNNLKNLDFPDGRLKKIETGVIPPEKYMNNEVELFAKELDVPVEVLEGVDVCVECASRKEEVNRGLCLDKRFAELYPDLPKYYDLLNASIAVNPKLCRPIFYELSEYLKGKNEPSKNG